MRVSPLLLGACLSALALAPQEDPADQETARVLRGLPDRLVSEAEERPIAELRQSFLLPILETELEAMDQELKLLGEEADSERKQLIEAAEHEIRLLHKGLSSDQNPSTISKGTLPLIDRHLYGFARDHLRFDPMAVERFEAWHAANLEFLEAPDLERRDRAVDLRQQALDSWPHAAALFGLIDSLGRGPLDDSERREAVAMLSIQYPELEFPAAELLSRAGGRSNGNLTGAQTEYAPDPTLPRIDGSEYPAKIVESLSKVYEEVSGK